MGILANLKALFKNNREQEPDNFEDRLEIRFKLKHDPVEDTKEYLAILPELEAKIEAALKDCHRGRGFCHKYWHTKREILERDYGIDWSSPGALNHGVMFD